MVNLDIYCLMSDFANIIFLTAFYLVIFFPRSLNEQTEKEIWKC